MTFFPDSIVPCGPCACSYLVGFCKYANNYSMLLLSSLNYAYFLYISVCLSFYNISCACMPLCVAGLFFTPYFQMSILFRLAQFPSVSHIHLRRFRRPVSSYYEDLVRCR
ncbi:hypothetical protein CPC08DRAFT_365068 [Agrocybe pediades]|nr:hypothetical protein CPC08DRAFT_365068 [Agrocybe pediades]